MMFWERCEEGGRKSFTIEELDPDFFLEEKNSMVPILVGLQKDLDEREEVNDE
jgi:recombination protein U